ncbi:hypothetical protein EIP91_007204 [Steccherinum ochraceum]|uniref:Uncharacterized protein n=1 Tax=Steccherinum ochraceum TaxID=92696 RepID=A0A4R0RA90_9APHY|nr:hypothetical protein EIP91_007204 [Steccherinum ochraceum]
MQAPFAELDSLVALITSAVADVKAEYTKLNLAVPDLTSVDDHPLDSMPVPRKLKKAVETVNGACAQLSTSLLSPHHAMYLRSNDYITSICIRLAYEAKVADLLKEHPNGLHISKIAAKCGIPDVKMARIMRLLATKQCFREVENDVFANNRLSALICSDNPFASVIGVSTDDQFLGGAVLYETLADKIAGPSYDTNHSPFARAHDGHSFWKFYHEIRFPWKDLPAGTTVCDLGSGVGYMSMDLIRLNPGINVVMQDTKETVELGKAFWQEKAPEAVSNGRAKFKAIDFLKEPPVTADVYYLKHILHNWEDKESEAILANIKKAMKPGSRIIIQDYVMRHVSAISDDEAAFLGRAPAPLPSNFGEGRIQQYILDIAMMILMNSRERTLAEFKQLGNAVGLEIAKVWDCGELSALEYRLPA